MKAFKVFWKSDIASQGEPLCMSAIIVADDITSGLEMAKTYGEVASIFSEAEMVISAPRDPLTTVGDEVSHGA